MSYTNGLDKPSDYFNTKLYTGNGSTNAITGVGFQPDWTICKARSYNDSHFVFDAVRGATKHLQTNSTSAEVTNANSLTAFGSDGFTLGSDGGANSNGDTYASWNWLASNTTASNSDGSITSTVSANTTSGFSICKWSGSGSNATIGHGLSAVPKMVITKSLGSSAWGVYNENLGNTNVLFLDTSAGTSSHIAYWNNTSPTSTVFSVGTDDAVNHSGNDMIAFCFSEVKSFSKFGSYVGNGSSDGSYIHLGFKPSIFICKNITDSGDNWILHDNKRDTFNVTDNGLAPNSTTTEFTDVDMDFLSNGVKMRNDTGRANSVKSFIFMAFAESPFTTSTGIPTTAK